MKKKILSIFPRDKNRRICGAQIKIFQDTEYVIDFIDEKDIIYTEHQKFIDSEIERIQGYDIIIINAYESNSSLAQRALIARILQKKVIVLTYIKKDSDKKSISPWILWLSNNTLIDIKKTGKIFQFHESIFEKIIDKKFICNLKMYTNTGPKSFYIGGPFKHTPKKDNFREIQSDTLMKKGYRVIDPCSKEHTGDFRKYDMTPNIVKKIVLGDVIALAKSEYFIYNCQTSSSGGGQEALLFKLFFERPIISIGYHTEDIWSQWLCSRKYHSFNDFSKRLKQHITSNSINIEKLRNKI
ncbi:MAG: hypothetical protein ACP5OA_05965 [Candidatus Woesearchaeota archaeon]